ncbi:MAG TPA: BLUF domain-containing protein [Longimicrobiales bacterium]|nr:BLUF domain-containing protein [Longimicrobiales bacterium]
MLVRLLYASRAVDPIDAKMLEAILEQSRAYNKAHGITGVLCAYEDGNGFLQVLEGARDEINRLYNSIVRDTRHQDVVLLSYEEIGERRFANWRMGRIDLACVNPSTLLRYSERAVLDPTTLSAKSALALLEELITTLPG